MTDPRTRKAKRAQWRKMSCPRCGGDCLRRAKLRELTVPSIAGTFSFLAWAMCDVLGEPIALGEVQRDPPVLHAMPNTTATNSTTTIYITPFGMGTWTS